MSDAHPAPTLRRPLSVLDRWAFAPQAPEPLAICRIVVCASLFVYYFVLYDFRGWDAIVPIFYERVGLFGLLGDNLTLGDPAIYALQAIWGVSLLLGALGLFTRTSLTTAAILAFYFLGLRTAFGKVSHSEPMVVFMLVTLALSRCGDALSLDRRLFARRAVGPSGEYRWPIRTIWIVMAIVFAFAGWNKLDLAGVAWAHPDSFVPMMLRHFYANEPPVDWGIQLAYFKPFVWMGGILTLVGECLFPLVLVSRKARLFFVPLMFGMQANIALLFGVYFWPFLPAYAFFVPWDWLLACRRAGRIVPLDSPA